VSHAHTALDRLQTPRSSITMGLFPESIPMGIPVELGSNEPTESLRTSKVLVNRGFPKGLAAAVLESVEAFPYRMWVVDDSGSMACADGQRLLPSGNNMVKCTRAEELAATVKVQAELAAALHTRVEFHFLNGPSVTVDGIAESYNAQLDALQRTMGPTGRANGSTPLTETVLRVISGIEPLAATMRAAGQRAVVVIATDGHPNNPRTFLEAMKRLQELPVLVVVRLCTSDSAVVEYWSSLDCELERPLEVLDDVLGEAQECANANPWLSYSQQLHDAREFGLSHKLFDLLDEAQLLPTQVKALLELIFGCTLPEPQAEWPAFRAAVEALVTPALVLDPLSRTRRPWVDAAQLTALIGPKLRLRLRGQMLKKLDFFSQSDPFVRVKCCEAMVAQTEHIDNNANPTWQELVFVLPAAAPDPATLHLAVFDHTSSGSHKLIGAACVRIDELLAGKVLGTPIELLKDGKGGRGAIIVDGAVMDY